MGGWVAQCGILVVLIYIHLGFIQCVCVWLCVCVHACVFVRVSMLAYFSLSLFLSLSYFHNNTLNDQGMHQHIIVHFSGFVK